MTIKGYKNVFGYFYGFFMDVTIFILYYDAAMPIKIRRSVKPAQPKTNQYSPLSFSIYFGWEKLGQLFPTAVVMAVGIRLVVVYVIERSSEAKNGTESDQARQNYSVVNLLINIFGSP